MFSLIFLLGIVGIVLLIRFTTNKFISMGKRVLLYALGGLFCLVSVLIYIIMGMTSDEPGAFIAPSIVFAGIGFLLWKRFTKNILIKYFVGLMSGADYDAHVKRLIKTITQQTALSKFDLDESELNELPPVCLSGYHFDEKEPKFELKKGKDGIERSSVFQVSWLFFSAEQVCVFQHTFNLFTMTEKKVTKQYFWKEIVAFNTFDGQKTLTFPAKNPKKSPKVRTVDVNYLSLIVSNDHFDCAMPKDDSFDKTLRGMKATLKAKKEG